MHKDRNENVMNDREHERIVTLRSLKRLRAERNIRIPYEQIAEFCRRNHIRRLALFGSVLRDDFGPESDIDVLVEFEPGHTPGLAFFSMQDELSQIFNRNVDLNTPGFLSKYFRDEVLSEAETLYVQE